MAWGLTALSPPDHSLALTTVLKSLHPELGRSRAVRAEWERRAGTGLTRTFRYSSHGPLCFRARVSQKQALPLKS